jgi:antitoxin VapB
MVATKLFKSNKSQAVRLPKAVAFPDDVTEVEIIKVGENRMIVPKGKSWEEFFKNVPLVDEDFSRGDDLPPQEREWF